MVSAMNQEIERGLNHQINEDYAIWYFQQSAAAFFHARRLSGLAHWLEKHSKMKAGRASKLSEYLVQRGGQLVYAAIAAPYTEFDSPLSLLRVVLEREREQSRTTSRLASLAIAEEDYATANLLERIVAKQTESVTQVENVVKRLELAGDEPVNLLMIDRILA